MLIETIIAKLLEKALRYTGIYSLLFSPKRIKKRQYPLVDLSIPYPDQLRYYPLMKKGLYQIFDQEVAEDHLYSPSFRNTPFWKVKWVDTDPKDFWEIARGWQWSMAYFEAKRSKEENIVIGIILEWFDKNPYPNGLGWAVALEVAIRAINLYLIACDSKDKRLNPLLDQHVQYLKNTLWISKHAIRNNHYFGELIAYAILTGKKTQEVREEIGFQFYPDGVNIEQSIQYHRFSLEFLLLAQEFLPIQSNIPSKAISFLSHIRKQDGTFPNIGDNDQGCVCPVFTDSLLKQRDTKTDGEWKYEKGGFYILKNESDFVMV